MNRVDNSKSLEFIASDKILLKVVPTKRVIRFGQNGKLNIRFIGSFEIFERVRDMTYRNDFYPIIMWSSLCILCFHATKIYSQQSTCDKVLVILSWRSYIQRNTCSIIASQNNCCVLGRYLLWKLLTKPFHEEGNIKMKGRNVNDFQG